jgi:uncharacterized repeat protein (TIGR04042 family)
MPEMRFQIRWPDGAEEICYSPSLVIKDHLSIGTSYSVVDFLERSRTALMIASDRVQAKYGMPCSRALRQLALIEDRASRFTPAAAGHVTVLTFEE